MYIQYNYKNIGKYMYRYMKLKDIDGNTMHFISKNHSLRKIHSIYTCRVYSKSLEAPFKKNTCPQ